MRDYLCPDCLHVVKTAGEAPFDWCPNCGQSIKSVHVVGLAGAAKDSGVRGLVVTCPECESSVPPEIAGL